TGDGQAVGHRGRKPRTARTISPIVREVIEIQLITKRRSVSIRPASAFKRSDRIYGPRVSTPRDLIRAHIERDFVAIEVSRDAFRLAIAYGEPKTSHEFAGGIRGCGGLYGEGCQCGRGVSGGGNRHTGRRGDGIGGLDRLGGQELEIRSIIRNFSVIAG